MPTATLKTGFESWMQANAPQLSLEMNGTDYKNADTQRIWQEWQSVTEDRPPA